MMKTVKGPCKGGDDCTDQEHLCKIEKRHDTALLAELMRTPEFLCRKCGRKARSAANLCRAERL